MLIFYINCLRSAFQFWKCQLLALRHSTWKLSTFGILIFRLTFNQISLSSFRLFQFRLSYFQIFICQTFKRSVSLWYRYETLINVIWTEVTAEILSHLKRKLLKSWSRQGSLVWGSELSKWVAALHSLCIKNITPASLFSHLLCQFLFLFV